MKSVSSVAEVQGRAGMAGDEGLRRGLELGQVRVARAGPVEEHRHQPVGILLEHGADQHQELGPAALGQAADDAEIDEADPVVRHDQHVAGMRVGVEHALDQRHLQEGVGALLGEQHLVDAGRVEAGDGRWAGCRA